MGTARHVPESFRTYLAEINRTPLMTTSDEKETAAGVVAGNEAARDRMIRANLRLVVNIALSYTGRGVPIEDLVSEGNLGLMRAVEGYDPSMNTRFSTYATFWINQSIRRGIVNAAKIVRIPVYMTQLHFKWARAKGDLTVEFGRLPTHEEVTGRLGLSERQSRILAEAIRVSRGLPSEPGEGSPGIAETVMDSRLRTPEALMTEVIDIGRLMELLDKMEPREAAVLRMRFGFDGDGPKTCKQVGVQFGLSRERIRQIESDAIAKLAESIGDR
ncbi:sigma-70 family RNA polymerase sigma factor [Limnoglobus roseus]|uniref:RNA polymerase sigma factor n=1 Tax=Limnoglobus roseus TaxID=2598579 RepID=A0A5C1AF63_9BACT|nr:RNA polymerase sigma factor RpoD/SigA [Limnoglobus roseus]QEL16837.1 RNA polymerase sigma factor RpoD/SigA [Limnoglobus roseus]